MYNMKPIKMTVTHINFYCRKRETLKTEIRYVLDNSISFDERVLFPTEESCNDDDGWTYDEWQEHQKNIIKLARELRETLEQ